MNWLLMYDAKSLFKHTHTHTANLQSIRIVRLSIPIDEKESVWEKERKHFRSDTILTLGAIQ